MQESRRQFVAALTAGVTGALAGCGGNESATPTSETPTATDTATPTSADREPTPAPETETAEGATPQSSPTEVVSVGADGLRFSPSTFEITVGDTVQWEWEGSGHNVVPDSIPAESDWSGTEGSGTFGSGHTYSYTFEIAGQYDYYCAPHQSVGMTGSFTVTE